MRLAQLLFKPKWQDKNAGVRRAAVSSGREPELLAALPRLMRDDPDPGVRLAALKRLDDYETWRERSTGDADASLRGLARSAYLALLCTNGDAPPLARRIAELETLSADEIERVAAAAESRELRAAALTRVGRQSVLVERAIADADPELRLSALERIAERSALERIAERTRKTDKAVSRRARERAEGLRIAAGDSSAILDRARMLCERAEALMRAPGTGVDAALAALEREWLSLRDTLPGELGARFRGACALAASAHDAWRAAPAKAPEPPVANEPEPEAPAPIALETTAEALASRARFDAALAAAEAEARAERERRKLRQREIEQCIAEFGAALDAGDSGTAHRLHTRIEQEIEESGDAGALRRLLAPHETRYAELKRWQHWSNNQRRRALCADVEALLGSGLHPDALATRVRDARAEWQRLNVAEGLAADDVGFGIARRFHALCQQALKPTKVYFSKRQEVRKSREDEIGKLLERVAAAAGADADWKALGELRTEASAALRGLDSVDPRARTALAKRLKQAIADLSERLEAHERDIEGAKQRLVELATALGAREDRVAAAREARDLQKRWTALGNGRRSTDQRQWREFRAACDAVFGQLDASRKEREAQAAGVRQQATQLLDELEALAQDDSASVESTKAALRDTDARWQTLGVEDRALLQRQRTLREAVALRLKDAARRTRLAHYFAAMRKYALVREMELGAARDDEEWRALGATAPAFDVPLEARRDGAINGSSADPAVDAQQTLVQLELVAGIESVPEDRERRMNQQLQRLSAKMRGGTTASPEAELDGLLAVWFSQPPQAPDLEKRFERAALAAIDALP
ncbi:MAG TPA: DUF349 domain-containing protein [Rudaea sp.]|nr:DUF349 domain-containing protein [Rudaea sp.]